MSSLWEERYIPMFRDFIRKRITKTKPDYIVLPERRGKLFDYLEAIPTAFHGYVGYDLAYHIMHPKALVGKKVMIVDDAVQHGSRLSELRRFFGQEHNAEVKTYALVARKSAIENGFVKDIDVEPCLTLKDPYFKHMYADITEYLLSTGVPLDVDHVIFKVKVQRKQKNSRIDIENVLLFLSRFGYVYTVPSPARDYGVFEVTLDLPVFFNPSKIIYPTNMEKEPFTLKVRIYIHEDTSDWYIVPIAYPSCRISPTNFGNNCKGFDKYFIHLCDIINNDNPRLDFDEEFKTKCCYRCIALNMSALLGMEFIRVLKEEAEELHVDEIEFIKQDFVRYYGNRGLRIFHILEEKLESILSRREYKSSTQPRFYASNQIYNHRISRYNVIKKIIELCRSDFIEKEISEKDFLGTGLSLFDIQEKEPKLGYINISEALDILLDVGILKPLIECRPLSGKDEYICVRSYRKGEDLDLRGYRRERERQPRIFAVMIEKIAKEGKKDISSFSLHKTLANLIQDWDGTPLHLKSRPEFFGPMIYCEEIGVFDPAEIHDLCKDYGYIFHYYFDKRSKMRYTVEDGWDKDINSWIEEDTLILLETYGKIYSLLNDIDLVTNNDLKVDVFTTLSMSRNWRDAYKYAYRNLIIWMREFSLFLNNFSTYLLRREEKIRNVYEKKLNRAATSHFELKEKIERYDNLAATKEKIKSEINGRLRTRGERLLLDRILGELEIPPKVGKLDKLRRGQAIVKSFTDLVKSILSSMDLAKPKQRSDHNFDYYKKEFLKRIPWLRERLSSSAFEKVGEIIRKQQVEKIDRVHRLIDETFERICRLLNAEITDPEREKLINEEFLRTAMEAFQWAQELNFSETTVLIGDLTDYSNLTDQLGGAYISRDLINVDEIVDSTIGKYKESVLKKTLSEGDKWVAFFSSCEDAVACAVQILQKIEEEINRPHPEREYPLRMMKMGIEKTPIIYRYKQNEISNGINIASRLGSVVKHLGMTCGIVVSSDVKKKVENIEYLKGHFESYVVPSGSIKNIEEQEVFNVDWENVPLPTF